MLLNNMVDFHLYIMSRLLHILLLSIDTDRDLGWGGGAMLYLDIVWLEGTRSQTGCEYVQNEKCKNKCNIDLLHYIFMLCFIQLYR